MPGRTPEEEMRAFLLGESWQLAHGRRYMRRLPAEPHCKLCAAPFGGLGGVILGRLGFSPFSGNPAICSNCIRGLNKVGVLGAEIPATLLFADIRGSTAIGERLSPSEFRAYLDRFYRIASRTVLSHDGLVDKFVGDEVIGLFFQGVSGTGHAAVAIETARDLLAQVGAPDVTESGPIPVGAAVHTGPAFVGSTGADGRATDFTALGDVVNTTARLAGAAGTGELLVSVEAAAEAGLEAGPFERRIVDVRGRSKPIEVLVVSGTTTASAS
jgi:adenylate cyclase